VLKLIKQEFKECLIRLCSQFFSPSSIENHKNYSEKKCNFSHSFTVLGKVFSHVEGRTCAEDLPDQVAEEGIWT